MGRNLDGILTAWGGGCVTLHINLNTSAVEKVMLTVKQP
jgi:hypothetical protein